MSVDERTRALRGTALDLVARYGHLTPETLKTLPSDELEVIFDYVEQHRPDLAAELSEAYGGENVVAVWGLEAFLCGWLNLRFDRASLAAMRQLPEDEQETFRALPVNGQTWRQLVDHAIWHNRPQRYIQNCGPLRCGPRRREPRRANVRRAPRKARAPAGGDDDPPGEHHVVVDRRRREVAA